MFLKFVTHRPYPHSEEFGTTIEDDDDINVNAQKELSLEHKLELEITKKIEQLKIPYRNQQYPKPFDDKSIHLKMRDLECLSPPHAYTMGFKYMTGWVSMSGTVGSNLKSETQTEAMILWI
ncbi:hypothetical protein TNCV_2809411 [Trichonephila clavipes]|nr:hypothetical protein TNCV_2809411 [Trichonephila clavipes]